MSLIVLCYKTVGASESVTGVTGRVGTMKRKREIRAILENNDKGYEDDIFDSTPFKKQLTRFKVIKLYVFECQSTGLLQVF